MPHSTDLHKVEPVEQTDDLFDDVAWLTDELADASPERESDLMRLLLSRVTLNNMFQFCALLDARGTMWDVNDAALRGAGLSRRDIHGKPFWEARWWQSSPEAPRQLRDAIDRAAHGEFVRYDVDIIGRASGREIITIDFNIKPVPDRNGTVRFLICEGRDVTEQRRLEHEVARQREELAKLDELKTQFFANISHEFRTPLTLMLGPIEDALADLAEPLAPRQRERTAMIQRNGLRLQKLVNVLLDFSRVEAGRIQALYQPTDLASFTQDLASSFRSACEKAGLALTIESPPLPEPVFVDREMWEKIVLNLISNAFKFTFEGGIKVEVCAEDGDAVLRVSDTGTGIPETEVPLIFDRFHRVEGARGRTHEGTGIGLALVQELVKLHHGSVAVESTLGRGATFTVRVPLGRAHLPQSHLVGTRTQVSTATRADAFVNEALRWLPDDALAGAFDAREEPPSPQPGVDAERARVLLADDNADMRDYLCRLLAANYDVTAVSDGEEALASARRSRPDLVLTDVMMPRLDGFELLRSLRNDPNLRDIPVIVLSARAGEEAKVEGLQMGADDYLVKPFGTRELLARVKSNLELARTRSQSARILREESQILEVLNHVGTAVAAETGLERTVQVVTDAATELSHAAFGSFFYNVEDETGERYTLYTLSGTPRAAFARFPMPRNTAVFGPTFRGEGIVRSDDITKDPRYGKNEPYFGMPDGRLPVRSYLAVPVVSRSGDVLGGLFFGHPDAGIFTERAERIVAAIAVQAGIALEKAELYRDAQNEIEARKSIELALRKSEETLEAKVAERTAELAASNIELRAEAEQRERAEGRFALLVEGIFDCAIFMLNPTGVITNWNTGAERIKGYSSSEIIGQHFSRFYTEEDRAANLPAIALNTAATEGKYESEGWRVRKDGSRFWANVLINAIRDKNGSLLGFAKITRDITERRDAMITLQRTQEQLAQAQKMEGIGHLTGGIAHDFNNLLTIIIGNLETVQRLLQNPMMDANRLLRTAGNAMRGAERAAALTQRLLAFSRQQPLDPKIVDVSRLIAGMSDLLWRSLGEKIVVETVLTSEPWRVHVDPHQLEIAIVNLAINARDAMEHGGNLIIETANVHLDELEAARQADLVAGQYAVISITDTGCGMTPEVAARAFEPFYTTKDVGHGTGLGLSQVYGFVKQSGGHVKIFSVAEYGTTVKIYLPRLRTAEKGSEVSVPRLPPARSNGSETILIVEDNEDVRAHTNEILRELGYRTLEAGTGNAALQILEAHPEIQLLFTDVGLPGGMNGRQLADQAKRRRTDLKVLFTTGYARDAIVHDGRLDTGVQLITKPFTYAALASKVRGLLDTQMGPMHILLVEDDLAIQEVVVEFLEALGFKIETAGSVSEAMTKLRVTSGAVDAAIIDFGLPGQKGDVLVAELRTIYPSLPIVIASGYGDEMLRARFKDNDRISFLRKPYNIEQLQTVLASLTASA